MICVNRFTRMLFREAKVVDLKLSVLCWAEVVVECVLGDVYTFTTAASASSGTAGTTRPSYTSYRASRARCNNSAFFCATSVTFMAVIRFSKRVDQRVHRSDNVVGSPCTSNGSKCGIAVLVAIINRRLRGRLRRKDA